MRNIKALLTLVLVWSLAVSPAMLAVQAAPAQQARATATAKSRLEAGGTKAAVGDVPDAGDLDTSPSEMRPHLQRYAVDAGLLGRSFPVNFSPARAARFRRFYTAWRDTLAKLNFDSFSVDGRVDYILFRDVLDYELRQLDRQQKQFAEAEPLLPFARAIIELAEDRRAMKPVNPAEAAALLTRLKTQIEETQRRVEASAPGARPGQRPGGAPGAAPGSSDDQRAPLEPIRAKKTVVNRAVTLATSLRNALRAWFNFHNGYNPLFTWWAEEPYRGADQALANYTAGISDRVLGVRLAQGGGGQGGPGGGPGGGGGGGQGGPGGGAGGGQRPGGGQQRPVAARAGDASDIIGDPIGREALLVELANEMIPYTPEELISLANKELAWCEAEMVKASRELGYSDDWRKALEHVKTLYVEPGKQPELIREQAWEAIRYMEEHDLVTVPQLARDGWRMEMMSLERQLVNPFFTGGETISVSYPTNAMQHEQKMMSMRGNNVHFSHATVFHELIPGHHLQGFMTARYRNYRGIFSTPFWGEGWALYWELLLWDMGFHNTPQHRIGALFWRMHRCARIIFSLSFHLEKMTPQECIDFLVNRIGHERENATAEVRRSFNEAAPLYQAAYLLGGLQFRALNKELVGTGPGKMTNRAFHDAILRENRLPVEMVRALLMKQKLPRDFQSTWKFYGPNP